MRRTWKSTRRWTFESLEVRSLMSGDGLDASASALFSTAADEAAFPTYESEQQLREVLLALAVKRFEHMFGERQEDWPYAFSRDVTPLSTNGSASDTNVQVGGIDEADLVENDGRYLFQVSGPKLVIVDTQADGGLKVAAQIDLPQGNSSIYLSGDRLTVVTRRWGTYYGYGLPNVSLYIDSTGTTAPYVTSMSGPTSIVTVYDVSDRTNPVFDHEITIEGNLIDSRRIGDQLYLASSHAFQLPQPLLKPDEPTTPIKVESSLGAIDISLVANNSLAGRLYSHWNPWWQVGTGTFETKDEYLARVTPLIVDMVLPHYRVMNSDGSLGTPELLAEATEVYRREFTDGASLVSVNVLGLAVDAPQTPASVVVPMWHPTNVYMSHENLYLASTTWDAVNQNGTEIAQFALGAGGLSVKLAAVGAARGRLLDQFSMDEFDGHLRIATQVGWDRMAFSNVFVLQRNGQSLDIVGRLENLAPGERMFSSRFDGPRGFVVTFGPEWQPDRPQRPTNWVDPLFSIDLSDPTSPQLRGRLEIPGLSNYLHFVDPNHLIGFGRDADIATGNQLAPQLSLFDVTDMANPRLLARLTIPSELHGWSAAFSDHHAISYYPQDGLLAIPFASRVVLFKVDLTSSTPLAELGSIDLVARTERSARIDDRLYSIAESYIQANDLTELKKVGLVYHGDLAFTQHFVVDKTNVDRPLNVIDTQPIPDEVRARLKVVSFTQPSGGGTLRLADDGHTLLYTPAADFAVRSESFSFTVADEDGRTQTAVGSVNISWDAFRGPMRAKAMAALAELLHVNASDISDWWSWSYNGSSNSDRMWKDTCLEAGAPGEPCVETPTPGFEFQLYYAESKFIFRTDMANKVVFVRDELNVGNDEFTLTENSTDNVLDVLFNDYMSIRQYASPKIAAVSATSNGGSVSISEDGQRLIYSPASGFVGVDRFTYTLEGGEEATVKVRVPWGRFQDEMVLQARYALAELIDANFEDIKVIQVTERVWPDNLLGTQPREGEERIDRWTAGFEVMLRYKGVDVYYNTDTTSKVRLAYSWGLALPDNFEIANDEPTELAVLANDYFGSAGGSAIQEVTQGTAGGQVALSANGRSVIYTPAAGFVGIDQFTYVLSGIRATVTVSVKPAEAFAAVRARWHNAVAPADINNDGLVTPLDVLVLVNQINRPNGGAFARLTQAAVGAAISDLYCDPNGDGYLTPADVLHVINAISAQPSPVSTSMAAYHGPPLERHPDSPMPSDPQSIDSSFRSRLASSQDDAGTAYSSALQGQAMTAPVAAGANKFDSLPVSENGSRGDEVFDAIARELVGAAS